MKIMEGIMFTNNNDSELEDDMSRYCDDLYVKRVYQQQ